MLGRKKSPDHRALDLSEKSSHSAASIALAPDSHCCQLRCVRCTKAEASAVESPADSRACRISEGVGAVISAIGGRVEKRFHVCLVESLRQFATVRTFNFPSMVHAADTAFNTAHVIADALCLCSRENDSAVRINLGANGYFARVMGSAADGDFLGGGHDLLRLSDSVGLEVISRTVTVDKVIFAMRFIGFYQLTEGLIPSILIAMNKSILLSYKLVQMMTFLTVFSVLSGLHDLLRLVRGLIRSTHEQSIANNVRAHKSYFAFNENNFVRAA